MASMVATKFRNALIKLRRKQRSITSPLIRRISPYKELTIHTETHLLKFHGFRDDYITHRISSTKEFYELPMLSFIRDRYGTGGTYIDAGAFIGNHTLFFSSVCEATKVIAIEPNTESFRLLSKNVESSGLDSITPLNVAVGAKVGKASSEVVDLLNLGMNEIVNDPDGDLQVRTIDEIAGSDDVKLIKIDTEGWCGQVISGASDLIERCHPVIAAEPKPESVESIDALLLPRGYARVGEFNRTPTYIYEWNGSE